MSKDVVQIVSPKTLIKVSSQLIEDRESEYRRKRILYFHSECINIVYELLRECFIPGRYDKLPIKFVSKEQIEMTQEKIDCFRNCCHQYHKIKKAEKLGWFFQIYLSDKRVNFHPCEDAPRIYYSIIIWASNEPKQKRKHFFSSKFENEPFTKNTLYQTWRLSEQSRK